MLPKSAFLGRNEGGLQKFRFKPYLWIMQVLRSAVAVLGLCGLCGSAAMGQKPGSNPNDSLKANGIAVDGVKIRGAETDSLRRFYSYPWEFSQKLVFERSVQQDQLHQMPMLDAALYFPSLPLNLGNLGSAVYPLYFSPESDRPGLLSGPQHFSPFLYLTETTPLYELARPYTELAYQLGSFEEHWFQADHAQAFAKGLYAGFSYRHINSKGAYQRQDKVFHNGRLFLRYASASQRYQAYLVLTHNDYSGQENGGLLNDSNFIKGGLLNGSNFIPNLNRSTYPVRLNAAGRTGVHSGIRFAQRWQAKADSSGKAFPLGLVHGFEWRHSSDTYSDLESDSTYYAQLLFARPDARARRKSESLIQEAGVFWGGTQTGKPAGAAVLLVHEYYSAGSGTDTLQTADTSYVQALGSQISGHHLSVQGRMNLQSGRIGFQAQGQGFLSGYRQGDISLMGSMNCRIGNPSGGFDLYLMAGAELRQPGYFDREMNTHFHQWNQNFQKEQRINLGGWLHTRLLGRNLEKGNTERLDLTLWLQWRGMNQFVWFDQQLIPLQNGDAGMQAMGGIRSHWKFGLFQPRLNLNVNYSSTERLPLPLFVGELDLAVQARLFKKNLHLRAGVDASYVSEFQALEYAPAVDRFFVGSGQVRGGFALADVYVNCRIKSVDFFVRLRNASQGLVGNPYMLVPGYPLRDRYVQIGLIWGFVN